MLTYSECKKKQRIAKGPLSFKDTRWIHSRMTSLICNNLLLTLCVHMVKLEGFVA